MSVNTLKCVNCNVVISEVLAFLRNRHDVMDNESLIRICVSAFSEEEIDEAKKLLFVTTKAKQKLVSRRKDKRQKDLEDMISVFKTIDPEKIPVFVAFDLHKLPPVSFDHVDVTKLLRDLLSLRAEVAEIKENYATKNQMEKLKNELIVEKTPIPLINSNINLKRGGYACMDSGPIGLPHLVSTPERPPSAERVDDIAVESTASNECSYHDSAGKASIYRSLVYTNTDCARHNKSATPVPVNSALSESDNVPGSGRVAVHSIIENTSKQKGNQPTMAEIVNIGEWKEELRDEDWITVQKSRRRNRFVGKMGKAHSSTGKFKAAESRIPLFISNVSKETSEADIREYIERKTNEVVKLEKVNMKAEKPYNAFKLYVSQYKINTFLEDNLWPEGVTFRRFIHFKKRTDAVRDKQP